MSEVKPDTPKLCPEPGCGMEMHTGPSLTKDGWVETTVCLRSDEEHRLCAKLAAAEAKVRELEEGDEALLAVLPEDFGAVEYIKHLTAANAALKEKLNTPETADFMKAVPLEAAHQVQRWGSEHDEGKAPEDWFWLLGYLAGKAVAAHRNGDIEKAKHHTISSAAALANWHLALSRGESEMRPGIADPEASRKKGAEHGE